MLEEKDNITISNTSGAVIGVDVSGSGNVMGKNIVVGNGTINLDPERLSKIKSSEYAESIKDFSQVINNQLKGYQLKEEQVKSINQAVGIRSL